MSDEVPIKKHPKPMSEPLDPELFDNELPDIVKINGYDVGIEQISAFEEGGIFGDYDDHDQKIRIVSQKNKDMNRTTFLHEVLHAIDFNFYPSMHIEEPQINILAQSLYQAMLNNDFCLHPDTLEDGKESENACFVKEKGQTKLKNCKLEFDGMEIDSKIVNFEDNERDFVSYNTFKKSIQTSQLPSEQTMQSAFVHAFVVSVNDIHNLKIEPNKMNFLGQQLYQVLKRNPICFRQKKENKK